MKILIAGDLAPQNRVVDLFREERYNEVLEQVKSATAHYDLSIVNLEAPIVSTGGCAPIKKSGPHLKTDTSVINAIEYAGFNAVTLANNHFRDYGDTGVKETLARLSDAHIEYVGGGKDDKEAAEILYKEIDGKKLALINCCEHEFSFATEDRAGSNPLNPIQQYYQINEAKQHADFVLLIVHGGHEMWQLPSPRMKETYRFFIDAGADVIVNHHQHCFSGYEIYKGKPIFYGIGNFCFDRPDYYPDLWPYGYMVTLGFADTISFELIPYVQCKDKPCVSLLNDRTHFNMEIKQLNAIIADDNLLADKTKKYYQSEKINLQLVLEPYKGRIYRKLFMLGILPRFMKNKKLLKLQNIVCCEAHRDKLTQYFYDQEKI